jgi:hypothetical protein
LRQFNGRDFNSVAGAVIVGALFDKPLKPSFQREELCRVSASQGTLQIFGTEIFPEQISFETHPLTRVRMHDGQIINTCARNGETLLCKKTDHLVPVADHPGPGLFFELLGNRLSNINLSGSAMPSGLSSELGDVSR